LPAVPHCTSPGVTPPTDGSVPLSLYGQQVQKAATMARQNCKALRSASDTVISAETRARCSSAEGTLGGSRIDSACFREVNAGEARGKRAIRGGGEYHLG
jgi:hypothetical protein